jgi:hypothetical protein
MLVDGDFLPGAKKLDSVERRTGLHENGDKEGLGCLRSLLRFRWMPRGMHKRLWGRMIVGRGGLEVSLRHSVNY